jgi:hypothetical protein
VVVEGGCRRRGEMETDKGEVRRPRGALADCLTCPLCQDLFREASAFAECLHTCKFFRSVILSTPPPLRFRFVSSL